ncbi:MAG: hypothetical protein AB1757_27100 [Acidobacteriota bacterium]
MKKSIFFALHIFVSIFMLMLSGQNGQAQKATSDVLDHQVVINDVDYHTIRSTFLTSLASARVPGGIITILDCADTQNPQVTRLPQPTLRETLDAIVFGNPEYRWQIDEGVINLLTTKDEPSLLKVQVNRLKVEKVRSIGAILDALINLPEVKEAIARLNLKPGLKIMIGPVNPTPPQYTLIYENISVRDALNKIAGLHGRAVWEYKERRCDGKTEFSIDFVVE